MEDNTENTDNTDNTESIKNASIPPPLPKKRGRKKVDKSVETNEDILEQLKKIDEIFPIEDFDSPNIGLDENAINGCPFDEDINPPVDTESIKNPLDRDIVNLIDSLDVKENFTLTPSFCGEQLVDDEPRKGIFVVKDGNEFKGAFITGVSQLVPVYVIDVSQTDAFDIVSDAIRANGENQTYVVPLIDVQGADKSDASVIRFKSFNPILN